MQVQITQAAVRPQERSAGITGAGVGCVQALGSQKPSVQAKFVFTLGQRLIFRHPSNGSVSSHSGRQGACRARWEGACRGRQAGRQAGRQGKVQGGAGEVVGQKQRTLD